MIKNRNSNLYVLSGIIMILGLIILAISYKPETFYNWTPIRPEVRDSVRLIQNDYVFEINLICPEDKNISQGLKRRRWLMDYCSNDELKHLLTFPDGKVIVTSFQGLVLKNDENIMSHLETVLYDTTQFVSGENEPLPVGIYCLRFVLGLDQIVFDGPLPPKFYCDFPNYKKEFTLSEINHIDSIYHKLDYDNYERFVQYIDYR
jgi:hypothetical protein